MHRARSFTQSKQTQCVRVARLLLQVLSASLCSCLILVGTVSQSHAEDIPVCSMARDDFVNAAFPDNSMTKLHRGKLLKYAHPPGLVVLIPAQRTALKDEVEAVSGRLAADGLVASFHSSIGVYGTFAEVAKFIEQQGEKSIFVIVGEVPDDSSQVMHLRSALKRILGWPSNVEELIERSKTSRGFSSRNRVEFLTGEVISTATVVHPRYPDSEIGLMVYIAYYSALSPSASSTGQQFFSRFFEGVPRQSVELTEFARQYFRAFGDERVKFGMTKETFVACS